MIAIYDPATGELLQLVFSLTGVDMTGLESVEKPEGRVRWDSVGLTFIDDVIGEALRIWEQVKAKRDALLEGTCASPLGGVDCDEASRLNISGAVQMALLAQLASQPFSIDWTMADNSIVTHDAAAMIAMGTAVGTFVATCHEVARGLRAAIEAATDLATLDAIDIEAAPWP